MRGRDATLQSIDWSIVGIYVILVLMGWANIYASVYNEDHRSIFDFSQNYGKQMIWILSSVVIVFAVMMTDREFFSVFSIAIYLVMILLLIAVLVFGREIGGSKSWFVIGAFRMQPAEFAKFATCMAIAKYLSNFNIRVGKMKTILVSLVIIGLPFVLILLQGDAGSALVYLSFVFLMYREGLSGNFLLVGLYAVILFIVTLLLQSTSITFPFSIMLTGKMVLVLVLCIIGILVFIPFWRSRNKRGGVHQLKVMALIITAVLSLSTLYVFSVDYVFNDVLSDHQRNRINELLSITSDPRGAGYNVNQSKIAIGSGGFSGKGYLQGTQTKYDFVPEQSTDFIFCTVGEEWGFVGSLVVMSLFITLLIRIVIVAERQRSDFSRIYGYGVASILFFHLAINIGMTIGLAPVIGIPLPFFSYGGSSLWGFTILLFVFVKLDAYRLESFR